MTFDHSRCQWCGEEGFDRRGLAHHVWLGCDVVKQLAEENIEDIQRDRERLIAAHLARAASADTLPKGQDAQQGLAGTESGAVPEGQTPSPSPSPAAGR